jgi:hypothetical protein
MSRKWRITMLASSQQFRECSYRLPIGSMLGDSRPCGADDLRRFAAKLLYLVRVQRVRMRETLDFIRGRNSDVGTSLQE